MAYLGKRDRSDDNSFPPPQKRGYNGSYNQGPPGGNFRGSSGYGNARGKPRPSGRYSQPYPPMKQGFNDARPPFDQNFEPRKMGPGSQFEPPRQPFDHSRHQGFDGGRFEGPLRPPYPKNFPGGFQQFPMGRDENAPQNPTNPPLEQKLSCVLLFTVLNPKYPITVDVMHTICTNSGANVKRIVITRKSGVQAMIEFGSSQEADSIKESLNGADIYSGCCTLKIEDAKVSRLTVTKNDQDTWDYTDEAGKDSKFQALLPDPKFNHASSAIEGNDYNDNRNESQMTIPPQQKPPQQPQQSFPPQHALQQNYPSNFNSRPPQDHPQNFPQRDNFDDGFYRNQPPIEQPQGPPFRYRGGMPHRYDHPKGKFEDDRGPPNYPPNHPSFRPPMHEGAPFELRGGFRGNRGGPFRGGRGGFNEGRGGRSEYPPMMVSGGGLMMMEDAPFDPDEAMGAVPPMLQQGSVMMVYGLDYNLMNCHKVFNLFCLYGNVVRVKFLKSRGGVAMVQLGDYVSCERAANALNGTFLFGRKILIGCSKQAFIQDVPSPAELPDHTPSFVDFMGNRNNRFTTPEAASKNRIHSSSKILYFFNAPPNMTEDDLIKVFANAHMKIPIKIKFFPTKTQKSSTGLIEFDNKNDAVEALVICNHTPLPNPFGKNPYILKFCFSDVQIKNSFTYTGDRAKDGSKTNEKNSAINANEAQSKEVNDHSENEKATVEKK